MEVHAEEFALNGLTIKITISAGMGGSQYKVLCKAFDSEGGLLWATDVLDKDGKPRSFYSLAQAISRAREIFGVYRPVVAETASPVWSLSEGKM